MAITDFLFKKKNEGTSPEVIPSKLPSPPFVPTIPMTGLVQPGKIDYNQHFEDLLVDKNQPGPDYLEFSKALQALKNMPLTEEQKYLSTYPTYLGMGINSEKLIKSAEFYLSVMDQEKKHFLGSLSIARKADVTDKEQAIKLIQNDIVELTKKIQQSNELVNKLAVEKQQAEQSLMVEESNFNNVFSVITSQINDHISKIKTYLNAVT